MISTLPHRTAIGVLMIVAGVALFAYWAWYFIHLARPTDRWDFSLMPLSVASIVVGATLGGLRAGASVAGPTLKRDTVRSLAVGAFVATGLNVLFNALAGPTTIDSYLWLWELQEPGAHVAQEIARFLYPILGYPWNVRVAVPCGYAILMAQWMVATLAITILMRLTLSARRALSRRNHSPEVCEDRQNPLAKRSPR
jgi:hypothetical protein